MIADLPLLIEPEELQNLLEEESLVVLDLCKETHVVAYDEEGGGNASRLLWTLEAMGHRHYSLLNGGLQAWANEGHPCSREKATPAAATFSATPTTQPVASTEYILQQLNKSDFTLWDAPTARPITVHHSPGLYSIILATHVAKAILAPGPIGETGMTPLK